MTEVRHLTIKTICVGKEILVGTWFRERFRTVRVVRFEFDMYESDVSRSLFVQKEGHLVLMMIVYNNVFSLVVFLSLARAESMKGACRRNDIYQYYTLCIYV